MMMMINQKKIFQLVHTFCLAIRAITDLGRSRSSSPAPDVLDTDWDSSGFVLSVILSSSAILSNQVRSRGHEPRQGLVFSQCGFCLRREGSLWLASVSSLPKKIA